MTNAAALGKATGLSAATVNKTLALHESLRLVHELTVRWRGSVFAYREHIGLINAGLEHEAASAVRGTPAPRTPRSRGDRGKQGPSGQASRS